jgi:hypothetical protein
MSNLINIGVFYTKIGLLEESLEAFEKSILYIKN